MGPMSLEEKQAALERYKTIIMGTDVRPPFGASPYENHRKNAFVQCLTFCWASMIPHNAWMYYWVKKHNQHPTPGMKLRNKIAIAGFFPIAFFYYEDWRRPFYWISVFRMPIRADQVKKWPNKNLRRHISYKERISQDNEIWEGEDDIEI